jgi:hypothetical protein
MSQISEPGLEQRMTEGTPRSDVAELARVKEQLTAIRALVRPHVELEFAKYLDW